MIRDEYPGRTLSGIGGVKRPGIVHRIDKDTSGLVVAAKNDRAHHALAALFADHDIDRSYDALVWGHPNPLQGSIEGPIGRAVWMIACHAAAIYRAFHARAADLRVNTLCPCDGCQQAGNLKIKLVGHVGGVAMQKVKRLTELAGVDVIVVHRMLKNNVPVPEYLLMTKPVHAMLASPLRERAAPLELDLDDFGATPAFYLDLAECTEALPPPRRLSPIRRLARHVSLGLRTLPYELGLRKSCIGFRNVPNA